MKTIIFGKKSILSQELKKQINDVSIYSLEDFLDSKIYKKLDNLKKYNIVINSFYPSSQLSNISSYEFFYKKSITSLSKFLDIFPKNNINKIIYSSSASIYNSFNNYNKISTNNREIYSSTKLACENLIVNYSKKNQIRFNIARIFNMYGKNDNFSIISKIIKTYKSKDKIILNNEGNSIRDFIHVKDVTEIYKKLLKSDFSGALDIGNGYGNQIKDIILKLGIGNFKIKNVKFREQNNSIAKINLNFLRKNNSLENFLKKELKITKPIPLKRIESYKKNLLNDYIEGSIIYGAGNAGKQLNKILSQNNNSSVYCFVDDNKNLINSSIDKKKIISYEDLVILSKEKIITNITIAIPSLNKIKLKHLINKINPLTMGVNFLPMKNELINDEISINDVNEGQLIDLLERKISKIDNKLIAGLNNKSILVTGAGGSIGSELVDQLTKLKVKNIIALDNSELALYNLEKNILKKDKVKFILGSISDDSLIKYLCNTYKINVVFHAAAYKHVNILENNISKAVENNIFGTLNLIKSIKGEKANIIIISTDKAAKPKSVLGLTKRISEIISGMYFKDLKINIVRFGNVFGSQGSAINLFIEQINKGGPITITDKKVKRYFMSVKEACNLVLQGSQLKVNGKILILNMGKSIYVIDIINKLINFKKQKNPSCVIKIKKTGLKIGEKMEEILSITKKLSKTNHPDIMIANEPGYSLKKIETLLTKLQNLSQNQKEQNLKKEMKSFLRQEIFDK